MGFYRDLKKALVEDGPMIARLLRIQFHKSTMSDRQKKVYEDLVRQVDLRVNEKPCDQQEIVVPASVEPRDAEKALRLIKLEFDKRWDFHVTWEGEDGKKTLITEKPKQPPAPQPPKP